MSGFPTGTVTFLFTDIEGSIKLWESNPVAMGDALARHDELLRQNIEGNDGYVFKTIGDAFCAAFATAPDALQAALAAQVAIDAQTWETETPLRVRMALHTGTAQERGGDYFGQSLNRAARLLAAGHGGQILLSRATQELTRDHLPASVTLIDLGQRRLKDLGRPEQVYQIVHPALNAPFPPLRSLDNPDLPNNLPQQITTFIGRDKQMEEVKSLLNQFRLVTLTGAGGAGKTRLSLQVAAELLDQYFDGVWFIELAALSDPALVPQTVADIIDVREQPGEPIAKTLVDFLRGKRMLLVLDNCEHIIGACASLTAKLLESCPHVQILTSSREALGSAGEQIYRVPTLSLPDTTKPQTVESVSQYEAVRLFIERAHLVQPAFAVTNANAPAVAQICWRLDGIPLAIELAAACVRSLAVEQIMARLDNRFRLLTGGSRTALPRQQTLRALIDWSYDLLTDREQVFLRTLSVFAGGWTLEASEAVCGGGAAEEADVVDVLTALVDKSLVVYEEQADGQGRYHLLETVRQYARDRLGESGEAAAMQAGHQAYFLSLAEEAAPRLRGPEAGVWLSRLEREHDNLRASLTWCEGESQIGSALGDAQETWQESVESWLRLSGALWRFWEVRGHYSEGRQWLGMALKRAEGQQKSSARAHALNGAGNLAWRQGDYEAARALLTQGLDIASQLEDQLGIAYALGNLGTVAWNQGDNVSARSFLEQSLAIKRQIGDQGGTANGLVNLGAVAYTQGDYGAARILYEQSLDLMRQIGDRRGIACVLEGLACVAVEQGDYKAARTLYEQSLEGNQQIGDQRGIACALEGLAGVAYGQGDYDAASELHNQSLDLMRQIGDQRGIASTLNNLGAVALRQGDHGEAHTLYEQSLAIQREIGNQRGIADALEGLAGVAYVQGDYEAARTLYVKSLDIKCEIGDKLGIALALEGLADVASSQGADERGTRLWGAADTIRETIGTSLTPQERVQREQPLSASRAALGDAAFTAAWDTGRAMTLEQAVEFALSDQE